MLNASGSEYVLVLILGIAVAALGYSLAEEGRRALERTPGGLLRASASDFPAYPRRADGGPRDGSGAPPPTPATPVEPVPGSAGQAPADQLSPPAWHPDPSGRYHYRWWTGTEWTSYVSTHGHVEVDTNPDQRIGPYS